MSRTHYTIGETVVIHKDDFAYISHPSIVTLDNGEWQTDREIVVREDLPNGDLGYPTTVEYAANRLFVCYYGQEADGVTCVQGTFVSLT